MSVEIDRRPAGVPVPPRPVLALRGLSKTYPDGTVGLHRADLDVRAGEMVAILGPNGCGKSTLLRSAIRLIEPTAGTVTIGGRDMATARGGSLRSARRQVGLVLQAPSLVRRRSVLANVATGALGRHRGLSSRIGLAPRGEFPFAAQCLDRVGLLDLAWRRADQLSGGQAQRAAIARALCQRPLILFADEPVASLDPEAAEEVMTTLRGLVDTESLAVLIVLHQPDLGRRYADRLVGMRDGEFVFDRRAPDVQPGEIEVLYARTPGTVP